MAKLLIKTIYLLIFLSLLTSCGGGVVNNNPNSDNGGISDTIVGQPTGMAATEQPTEGSSTNSILVSITLSATTGNLSVAGTRQFSAAGLYSDNSTRDLTALVTWTSSSPAIASLSATGLATGLAQGSTQITAS